MKKPQIVSSQAIYRSSWLSLFVDKVLFPGGRLIDAHHRLSFKRQGVAALVTNSKGELLLIQSFRYVTDTLEWEIPAGAREKGEPIVACARREVLEETGYQTRGHQLIYSYYPSVGISNLFYHIVSCKAGPRTGEPDANEVKKMRWFSKNEIQTLLRKERLRDGFSLTALLLHLSGKKR